MTENLKNIDNFNFGEILPIDFYLRESSYVAPDLLGKYIITKKDGILTVGMITETEAYPGWDAASHAYGKLHPTKRTEVQYTSGGVLYMYLIMGLHVMTSVVTAAEGTPDVVFIRSIQPIAGIDEMRLRRNYTKAATRQIASSSGRLTKALGLDLIDNRKAVYNPHSDVLISGHNEQNFNIVTAPRVNIGTFGSDIEESKAAVERQFRFMIEGSDFLSL